MDSEYKFIANKLFDNFYFTLYNVYLDISDSDYQDIIDFTKSINEHIDFDKGSDFKNDILNYIIAEKTVRYDLIISNIIEVFIASPAIFNLCKNLNCFEESINKAFTSDSIKTELYTTASLYTQNSHENLRFLLNTDNTETVEHNKGSVILNCFDALLEGIFTGLSYLKS